MPTAGRRRIAGTARSSGADIPPTIFCRSLSRGRSPTGDTGATGGWKPIAPAVHAEAARNLNALPTTDTELRLIARAATIGDNVTPHSGYNAPAANGTPTAL